MSRTVEVHGMQIDIKIGTKEFVLQGNDDGTCDLCKWVKTKKEGEDITILIPFKFFTSLPSALERVFEMKVCMRDATTLKELMESIHQERKWLLQQLTTNC